MKITKHPLFKSTLRTSIMMSVVGVWTSLAMPTCQNWLMQYSVDLAIALAELPLLIYAIALSWWIYDIGKYDGKKEILKPQTTTD